MSGPDIIGIAVCILMAPIVINQMLDFLIPGRWERRAYKRSIEEMKRKFRDRNY